MISRVLTRNVSANLHYFRFLLLPGLHIQICQIVAVTIMFRQFHEFFESSIWRVFVIWPNCATAATSAKAADFDNWVMKFFTKTWKNAANVKATYLVQANDTHPSWYVTVFFWVDLSTVGYKRYPAYLTDHLLKGVCLLNRDWIGAQMFPTCFNKTQCPRVDLNKKSLSRPKTTAAWKLTPHR